MERRESAIRRWNLPTNLCSTPASGVGAGSLVVVSGYWPALHPDKRGGGGFFSG